jgi:glucose/arabinose dehydrogenase
MFILTRKITLIYLFYCGLIATLTGCNSVAKTQTTTIKTQDLNPKPIKITLEDLPQPYASESASNSPKVIPVPDNPALQVPAGFKVNVFADHLPSVRWMTVTPDGDVLAVQSKEDKITLLQDQNQDGVAEVSQTFGDRRNNL